MNEKMSRTHTNIRNEDFEVRIDWSESLHEESNRVRLFTITEGIHTESLDWKSVYE